MDVVTELMAAYPEAVREKDMMSKLPLHWAVHYGAACDSSEAVVKLMIAAYPEAAQKKDKMSKLPLHWAAEKRASDAIVNALLAAYPAAAMEKDATGSIPKLSLARGAPADVLSGAPAPAKPFTFTAKPFIHVPIEDVRSSLTNADAAPRAKLRPAIKVIGVAAVAADLDALD